MTEGLPGLLLAVLDGDGDSKLVLADWLEERGDERASFVRERNVEPFEAVCVCLPERIQVDLGVRFAERALHCWSSDGPGDDRLQRTIDTGREFLAGAATWDDLSSACLAAGYASRLCNDDAAWLAASAVGAICLSASLCADYAAGAIAQGHGQSFQRDRHERDFQLALLRERLEGELSLAE